MRPVEDRYPVTLGYRQPMRSNKAYIHRGIDYGCPVGTKVVSTVAGVVVHAGTGGMGNAFGIHVVVKTGAVWHIYAHLSKASVKRGQAVAMGQVVGLSGATGNVTGAHVHYGEFTSYSYLADRTPKFPNVGQVEFTSSSAYVQNCASRKPNWAKRVEVLAAHMLASDASFLVCVELYALQRHALTKLLKGRYTLGAVNGGRVIYYRTGRWSPAGSPVSVSLGKAKKKAVARKFVNAATGKKLNIVAAHLSWEIDHGHARREEARQLVAWARAKFPDNRILFFGDFNAPALSRGRVDEVGPVMLAGGYRDATATTSTHAAYRLDRGFGGASVEFTRVRVEAHGGADAVHPGVAFSFSFPK